ncbi:uncharacterized protein Triagg1_8695 [Trichoderma aggressivum f. europaeum]|uniref:Polyketide synthase n=1 Tax=Trichoderma aggressivum f. europaeum TaxID=173218 RepID=A0AAE1LVY9_9HYPO|nr:hypothetical protein Triagg1_8695 [Trichoderma aggressivum f. europaeum]
MDDGSIAIVGMACRFANVASPTQFWDMIEKGRSGHGRIPERCFDADAWYHPSRGRRGAVITKSGFFLDDVSHFDAPFFSITSSEAAAMDPMQRLGLEVAYETFENAGITMQNLSGSRTAVYSGVMTADYQEIAEGDLFSLGDHPGSGTAKSILANRISWFFDLRGPSLSLDTACSSALYSLHLACQAVLAGECDQALVTGTNLILHPNLMAQFTAMHMITPDGISHTFDESANGYGRGEGVAAVMVKPLKDAIRDGDVVRAVIRATGANFDGKTTGMTVPSGDAQAELIRETYKKAGISMNDTCYFEAHGTGTPLGDPIEMQAIAKTIGAERKAADNGPLYVGSVKPNVGHTEGAAGLAGLIKAVLCLEAGIIPAVTRLKKLNPKLHMEDWNLIAPMENVSWPQEGVRRASVNSFGFGGANAHVVLDDALHYLSSRGIHGRHITHPIPLLGHSPINHDLEHGSSSSSATSSSDSLSCSDSEGNSTGIADDTASEDTPDVEQQDHLFVFSAQDQGSLDKIASGYAGFLKDEPQKDNIATMQSLSHILSEKRTKLDFRSFVVAHSLADLSASLEANQLPRERSSPKDKAIFVFTGQGAQRAGMARELFSDPVFSESIRRSQKVVTACGGDWDIKQMLMTGSAQELGNPLYSQPLCTAIQIGLVDMLSTWNVQPAAVVGHSSGEIAAAYSSGVLSHEDAMYVAYYRGTLSSVVSSRAGIQGSMLAAGISESEAAKYIDGNDSVSIACINSPSSVTLSGESSAVAEVHDALVKDGKFSRQLRTGVAYHSHYMAVVSDDSKRLLAGLEDRLGQMRVPMFSSVTEERIEGSRLGGDYWMENMLSPVRFAGALRNLVTGANIHDDELLDTEYSAIIEIGPSKTLQGPIKQILSAISPRVAKKLPYRSMLVAGSHARKTSLEAAGFLWSTGHSIDLRKVNGISAASELDLCMLPRLPSYPWNHENSFWHEHLASHAVRTRKEPRTDLLGMPVDGQNPFEPRWRNILSVAENPWLAHHRVASACLFPAAGYLVMAIEAVLKLAAKDVQKDRVLRGIELTDVTFETGLALPDDGSATDISITLKPHAAMDAVYSFSIYSDSFDQPVRRLVVGSVAAIYEGQHQEGDHGFELEVQKQEWEATRVKLLKTQNLAIQPVDVKEFYAKLASVGLEYGPTFQALESIDTVSSENGASSGGAACGTLKVPDTKAIMPMEYEFPHLLHPATLDSAFHLAFAALETQEEMLRPAVPVSIERVFISADLPSSPGSTFLGMASTKRIGKASLVADILFADTEVRGPQIVIESMGLSDVGEASTQDAGYNATNSVASNLRTADIVWKEDIAMMELPFHTNIQDGLSLLTSWLECYLHKYANANVLFAGAEQDMDLLETLRCTVASHQRAGGRGKMFSCSLPQSDASEDHSTLPTYMQKSLANGPYDAIILVAHGGRGNSLFLHSISRLLNPGGQIVRLDDNGRICMQKGDEVSITVDGSEISHSGMANSKQPSSTLLSTLMPERVIILERSVNDQNPEALRLRDSLTDILGQYGAQVTIQCMGQTPIETTNSYIISLVEYGQSLVYDWSGEDLIQFQSMVASARYVLWLTTGGLMTPNEDGLKYSLTQGLLRTVRAEYPQLVLPHLDISPNSSSLCEDMASIVTKILSMTLPGIDSEVLVETEYAELDNKIFIPRLVRNAAMDAEIELLASNTTSINIRLNECPQPLRLSMEGSVQWTPCEPHSSVGAGKVLVETRYVAGSTLETAAMPWAVVGIVRKVGARVSDYRVGDFVLPLDVSMDLDVKTSFITSTSDLFKVPENISATQLAYWITPFIVAHQVLINQQQSTSSASYGLLSNPKMMSQLTSHLSKKLQPNLTPPDSAGHSPLRSSTPELPERQHADTGGVLIDVEDSALRAALGQTAHWLGLNVFVVVPEGEQVDEEELNGCTILHQMTRSCSRMMRNKTGVSGIRLVLSSLQNPATVKHLMASLGPGGRFVAVNPSTNRENNLRAATPRFDVTLERLDTASMDMSNMRISMRAVFALFSSKTLTLPPLPPSSQKPISEIGQLLDQAQDHRPMIFSLGPQSFVPMLVSGHSALLQSRLDPAGTYIISGGMGALGLEMAEWLSEQGARHILLLSRSGKPTDSALSAIRRLSQQGCRCDVIRCDIISATDVEYVASQAKKENWRIRGIIQAAMVLADSPFESMTGEQWTTATAPKVQGSWNLHHALGCHNDLDFFILLSSISGIIGNSAQANYSAGNTFEDALAAHRRHQGFPATSLNLGLVNMDTGNIGSVDDFVKKFPHLASVLVSKKEVKAALQLAMRGIGLNGLQIPSQVVVGISGSIQLDDNGGSSWSTDLKFVHRLDRQLQSDTAGEKQQKVNYEKAIKSAKTTEEARLIIEDALRVHVAAAMSSDASNIDVDKSVTAYGIDSLKATEVRNWFLKEFDSRLSIFEILSPMPISRLALSILKNSSYSDLAAK